MSRSKSEKTFHSFSALADWGRAEQQKKGAGKPKRLPAPLKAGRPGGWATKGQGK